MAKSESTKKLSSSFSMDNILGQSPQKFDEDQNTPLRLGSTSPSMYQDRSQLSPISSSSVRSSCESPMGSSSNSPSPPLGPSPPLSHALGHQPGFNLAHAYAQAWAAQNMIPNMIQRLAAIQGQQQQQNQPQNNLAGKSILLRIFLKMQLNDSYFGVI